ncbi:MAG: CDP-alcohol phosphatidyltransferase [candidate division KSB1 bacterium]|nr:CDP-alcohol phosphatidyltransferase [candidate division KSB1 bacterium]MDZ7275285.1 CDP-alcohol phosphatidyltransferase [candidate division KSB1 bacterium]MDZ7287453.1 CDP-alcohol phosphatidyltransferase [candidate division KSB1 bacterium]MDZ7299567.1 CDP-alcohol phosphatidyltransferase [candidate division KSB1 bacterium]MDZ7308025.1 CDP-alcohol phosphatidyltransferase [candidate division KSB1 bacterium]
MPVTALMIRQASKNDTRKRRNWLRRQERHAITWLCRRTPQFVTSNILTGLGLVGAIVIFLSLTAAGQNRWWLMGAIPGLALHWLGDSLDGRLAYFRNRPRKWFGFALDLMMDWISLCVVAAGLALYFNSLRFVPIVFMVAYGGRMLIAVVHYTITKVYRIDSGKIGPTEVRLLLACAALAEIFLPGSLLLLTSLATLALLVVDGLELAHLLSAADQRDRAERPRDWGKTAAPVARP